MANEATLSVQTSNQGTLTVFSFGGQTVRFRAPKGLKCYKQVLAWDQGYLKVLADYGTGSDVEEYVDLNPILQRVCVNVKDFLAPIKSIKIV